MLIFINVHFKAYKIKYYSDNLILGIGVYKHLTQIIHKVIAGLRKPRKESYFSLTQRSAGGLTPSDSYTWNLLIPSSMLTILVHDSF